MSQTDKEVRLKNVHHLADTLVMPRFMGSGNYGEAGTSNHLMTSSIVAQNNRIILLKNGVRLNSIQLN